MEEVEAVEPQEIDPHSAHSSYRALVLEYVLLGELLSHLWSRKIHQVEVLRSPVDDSGYDLVLTANGVTRYIQLKATTTAGRASGVPVHDRLATKPEACILWVFFDADTLKMDHFRWYDLDKPGKRQEFASLPGAKVTRFNGAKVTQNNGEKVRPERKAVRRLPKGKCERLTSITQVAQKLFRLNPAVEDTAAA